MKKTEDFDLDEIANEIAQMQPNTENMSKAQIKSIDEVDAALAGLDLEALREGGDLVENIIAEDVSDLGGDVDRPAPLTKHGLPNKASVLPGQSDRDLVRFIAAWMKKNDRDAKAAAAVYAGLLGKTAPDSEGPEEHARWLAGCTPRQRDLLALAAGRRREKRRATARTEYSAKKAAAGEGDVREYVIGLTPEERAARRKHKQAEDSKRYRANQKLLKSQ